MFDIKALYEARSVEEALELRRRYPEASVLAGGTDLLIKIREGKLTDAELICIRDVAELRGVTQDAEGSLRIGPLTNFSGLMSEPLIRERIPVLGEAAGEVGSPQIRNAGTIGGNLCNGATSADTAPTLFAYDAVLELRSSSGNRQAGIGDFYLGPGSTDLRPGELLTGIVIPGASLERTHGCYIKYSMREALDISTLGCSVNLRLSTDGKRMERIRIAYGVAGPVPCRCPEAEARFAGAPCSEETARAFAKAAVAEISPRDSWRASRAFRLHIAEECAYRALRSCIERAGGAI